MTTSTPASTANAVDVVRAVLEAMGRGDLEGLLASLHEDLEVHEPPGLPYGGVYKGREGLQQILVQAAPLLDATTLQVGSIVSDGDRAFAQISLRTAGTGELVEALEEYTVTEGLVSKIRVFMWDPTAVVRAKEALAD